MSKKRNLDVMCNKNAMKQLCVSGVEYQGMKQREECTSRYQQEE